MIEKLEKLKLTVIKTLNEHVGIREAFHLVLGWLVATLGFTQSFLTGIVAILFTMIFYLYKSISEENSDRAFLDIAMATAGGMFSFFYVVLQVVS